MIIVIAKYLSKIKISYILTFDFVLFLNNILRVYVLYYNTK